jgi:hypothetical protein
MRRVFLASFALGVTLAAGCGGEDGGDRLTREEFVSRAEAVCEEYDGRIEELGEPESEDQLGEYTDELVRIVEDGVGELRELRPPEDLEEEYDSWMATNEEAVDAARELDQAVEDQDAERLAEIGAEVEQKEEEADELARDLGLDGCATD